MGFRDLFLFYVVTGISLRWIATAATHGPSSLVIWFAAWLFLYIPLALSVIHLSARFPAEGGFYVWIKKAFGERASFLSAWFYWVSNLPYFPAVLYFAASNLLFLHPALHRYSQQPAFFIVFSVTILTVLTILNVLGLNLAKWAHNLGAIAMWIPALIVIALGFVAWRQFGSATSFAPRNFVPTAHVQDMLFWPVIIFAFIGSEAASLMAEEIKETRRDIPRALLAAGVTVAFCYMLGTFCVLLAIPSSESSDLDGLAQAIAHTASRLGIGGLTELGAFLISISNIGAAGAYLAAASRLPFVAGLDGYLPAAFGQLHPRFKTPWISVLGQGLFGVLFAFLGQAGASVGGAYDVLVAMAVVITMVPFVLLFASMVRLQNHSRFRDQEPSSAELPRSLAVKLTNLPRWLSVLLGVVGACSASFAIVLSLIPPLEEPHKLLYLLKLLGSSAVVMGIGVLLFHHGNRHK
jgi:amino acid transporter